MHEAHPANEGGYVVLKRSGYLGVNFGRVFGDELVQEGFGDSLCLGSNDIEGIFSFTLTGIVKEVILSGRNDLAFQELENDTKGQSAVMWIDGPLSP
ncbi:hypothetical protein FA13DRAFT_1733094 [Coprinellus micaceus]|uniref:Uncharacterized protein n=1 Tax=Coprinellus micaceus TaxID=71717 RepID=A0A4Y7TAG2_COPMI|nr:hypothetical protein FA13DRAFT_1733094 [Coprinellus micaceus]